MISNSVIDNGLMNAVSQRNDHLFVHYVTRLKRIFNEHERAFIKKLLCELCKIRALNREAALNLASGILSENEMNRILENLNYDGYIVTADDNFYKFKSPVLKQWWKRHEC